MKNLVKVGYKMTREELGHIIESLMVEQNISIRDLAGRCGLAPKTIFNLRKGLFSPRLEIVDKILTELDATIEIKAKRSAE